jgi:CO dehydrogenase/acetyl-CoA synthase epsilon subunit
MILENQHLHIISFDVPYPANYGGVIDVYYKIRALHSQGIRIHLHCFEYGRAEARNLESLCEKVYYYKRKMSKKYLLNTLPFVVVTRYSPKLLENLQRDSHPILFEGLHSCYHLDSPSLKDRLRIVRMHNIEHDYYLNLEKVEKSIFRKFYFGMEAKKLQRFEKVLSGASAIAAISEGDCQSLRTRYNNVHHITAFHPNEKVNVLEGRSDYCLYHGNLEVGENNEAALFLVKNVFSKLNIPLVIAGKKPSQELTETVKLHSNISIRANINTKEIDALIRNAQINVLPTFQATGIKLKLLAALFSGRHCIVNTPMIVNTGLESLCSVRDSAEDMMEEVQKLFERSFDRAEILKREAILSQEFSNEKNVEKLIALLAAAN